MIQALRCGLAVDFGIQAIFVQVNSRFRSSEGGGISLLTNPLRGFVRSRLQECSRCLTKLAAPKIACLSAKIGSAPPIRTSSGRQRRIEREFLAVAHWPRMLGPGCGVLVADPLALLRLSLPNAGWRPDPRAWRSAASSLARVSFPSGSLRERFCSHAVISVNWTNHGTLLVRRGGWDGVPQDGTILESFRFLGSKVSAMFQGSNQ